MNFWLEFSSFLTLFYIHLKIFILCKNFRRLFSALSYSFFYDSLFFPFPSLGCKTHGIQAFFFLFLMNHFWDEGGKGGYVGLGPLSFSSSSSHFFLLHHV